MLSGIELEKVIYHVIRQKPELFDIISYRYFHTKVLALCYKLDKKYYLQCSKIPKLEQLRTIAKINHIDELTDEDVIGGIFSINIDQYESEWLDKQVDSWIKHRTAELIITDSAMLMQQDTNSENIDSIVENVYEIFRERSGITYQFDEGLDFFNPSHHHQEPGDYFSTGYPFIDQMTGGGHEKGSLICLCGESKIGKCSVGSEVMIIRWGMNQFVFDTRFETFFDAQKAFCVNNESLCDEKFIEVFDVKGYEVETDSGWSRIKHIGKTIPYEVWKIETINSRTLKCANTHILFDGNYNEIYVKDLQIGDLIQTNDGLDKIISIEYLGYKENMYDIEVDDNNHRYYVSDILSHNSIWGCNLAVNSMKLGHNTALVSLEMKDRKIMKRIGSNAFDVPMASYDEFSENDANVQDYLERLRNTNSNLKALGALKVKQYPASTASVVDIENYLRRLEERQKKKFEVVIIDYINIMKNWRNPNTENLYSKIKQIAEDLRAMMTRNEWSGVTFTQLNRDGLGNSNISVKNIAESAGLLHTVDALFGIMMNPGQLGHIRKYRLKALALRNADGANTEREFNCDFDYMRITEDQDSNIQRPNIFDIE